MPDIKIELQGKRINQELLDSEIRLTLPRCQGSSLFGDGTLLIHLDGDRVPAGAPAEVARILAAHNPDVLTPDQQQRQDDKDEFAQPFPAENDPDVLRKLRRRIRALERACRRAGILD